MGFRSDVAIAIHKETYAKHALLKSVPKVLTEAKYLEVDGALHWYLESQKWYDASPEIQEFHLFLESLDKEEMLTKHGSLVDHYGCLIFNEDNTTDMFGDPCNYGIEVIAYIDCPGRNALLKEEGFDV